MANDRFPGDNEAIISSVIAHLSYGYGYAGPWLLEFEEANVNCGLEDLEQVLSEYNFLNDNCDSYRYCLRIWVLLLVVYRGCLNNKGELGAAYVEIYFA